MSTTESRAKGRALPAPLRALLAPLLWLERSRGRRRTALAALYVLLVATAGVFLWRASRLSGVPDIGDPFDTRPLRMLRVPDDRNAFPLYKRACDRLKRDPVMERKVLNAPYAYPKGDAQAVAYLAANAEALALWRQGCERPEALYVPVDELTFETRLPAVQDHRQFVRLALVEASRLQGAGDVAGAWGWYRAILRGSRHVGNHGFAIGRLVGTAEYVAAATPIRAWMADPRVDAALLRRALRDVREANAMTGPDAELFQIEYISAMKDLKDPRRIMKFFMEDPWSVEPVDRKVWWHHLPAYWQASWFLNAEPERSRRIFRLAFANWLAHCDEPPARRPAMVGTKATPRLVYDVPGPGGLPAAELVRLIGSSLLAKELLTSFDPILRALDRDRGQRAALVIALAERLYTLERGKPPASPDDLVGPYLDRLPDGYVRPASDKADDATKGP
jgi:hypothetical protein